MRRSTLAVSAGRSPKKTKSFALSFAQRNTESRAYFQAGERLSDQETEHRIGPTPAWRFFFNRKQNLLSA